MIKTIAVEVKETDLLVEYEFQPWESAIYGIEDFYPGADESVSIESVRLYYVDLDDGDTYITDENIRDLLSEEVLEEITKQILTFETKGKEHE